MKPVTASDLIPALCWLTEASGVSSDGERMLEVLAGQQLALDSREGVRALQTAITDARLPLAWTEIRLRDAGVSRPCVLAHRQTGAVLFVEDRRWGRHRVRVVLGGSSVVHRWTTRQLATYLRVSIAATVGAIVAAPRLPLEPLRTVPAKAWARARALLALERGDIRLVLVYGIAIGILAVATPVAVQAVVNTVALGAVLDPLVVLTIIVAAVLMFAGVMRVLHAHVVEAIQLRLFIRTAADVTRRLFGTSPSALAATSPADVTARFLEIPVLQKALTILLFEGVDLLLRLVVGLTLLALYHPTLAVFSFALLVLLALVVFGSGRGAVESALDESDAKYKTVAWIEQTIRLAGTIRGEAGRRRALDRADHLVRSYRDARRAHFRKLVRTLAGGVAIQVAGSAALLGIGGALVVGGELTLGQLVAAELVFAAIASSLVKLHKQLEAAYDVVASSKKLGGLVELPLERRGGEMVASDGPLAVRLANATLQHADVPLVRDVTLAIAAGDRVAINGAAGSGKSTLLAALAAEHDLAAGTLHYDGLDLRQLSPAGVRSQICVLRDVQLADDTIEANLRLAHPGADLHELQAALADAGLADVVERLPAGLGTRIRRDGIPLSRSQARRLCLARALVARPRMLVVDGGLDGLGLTGDAKAQVLDTLFADPRLTLVVVTDDIDVLQRCTRHVQLAGGDLVEVPS